MDFLITVSPAEKGPIVLPSIGLEVTQARAVKQERREGGRETGRGSSRISPPAGDEQVQQLELGAQCMAHTSPKRAQ